jgi:hypothetical protein
MSIPDELQKPGEGTATICSTACAGLRFVANARLLSAVKEAKQLLDGSSPHIPQIRGTGYELVLEFAQSMDIERGVPWPVVRAAYYHILKTSSDKKSPLNLRQLLQGAQIHVDRLPAPKEKVPFQYFEYKYFW